MVRHILCAVSCISFINISPATLLVPTSRKIQNGAVVTSYQCLTEIQELEILAVGNSSHQVQQTANPRLVTATTRHITKQQGTPKKISVRSITHAAVSNKHKDIVYGHGSYLDPNKDNIAILDQKNVLNLREFHHDPPGYVMSNSVKLVAMNTGGCKKENKHFIIFNIYQTRYMFIVLYIEEPDLSTDSLKQYSTKHSYSFNALDRRINERVVSTSMDDECNLYSISTAGNKALLFRIMDGEHPNRDKYGNIYTPSKLKLMDITKDSSGLLLATKTGAFFVKHKPKKNRKINIAKGRITPVGSTGSWVMCLNADRQEVLVVEATTPFETKKIIPLK